MILFLLMELQMAAGRNFSRSYGTDTSNFIINEAAVKAVGWKRAQEAVGKNFKYGQFSGHIIGVSKRFSFRITSPGNHAIDFCYASSCTEPVFL